MHNSTYPIQVMHILIVLGSLNRFKDLEVSVEKIISYSATRHLSLYSS